MIYKYDIYIHTYDLHRLTYQTMNSTRTQSQLCIATPISSFVQCQVSFRLLPSSVATFIYIKY